MEDVPCCLESGRTVSYHKQPIQDAHRIIWECTRSRVPHPQHISIGRKAKKNPPKKTTAINNTAPTQPQLATHQHCSMSRLLGCQNHAKRAGHQRVCDFIAEVISKTQVIMLVIRYCRILRRSGRRLNLRDTYIMCCGDTKPPTPVTLNSKTQQQQQEQKSLH